MGDISEEKRYWIGFSVFSGIGPKRFKLILNHFKSAKTAWHADILDLESVLGKALSVKFNEFRKTFSNEKYIQKLQYKNIEIITLLDEHYPFLLTQIDDPPFLLYIKGNLRKWSSNKNDRVIAVVGTRKITSYGQEVTENFTRELAHAGYIIVSGLAYGVDACAHQATIDSGGITLAVLGCGVDCCTPRENEKIYDQILKSDGSILSEIPPGTSPTKGSFPSRNRIIAGLSRAVLVTEGAADSGALYTAEDAFKLNRPVFAVPGPITSILSKGPHSLIAKGGKLVTSAEDILNQLMANGKGRMVSRKTTIRGDTKEEQMIIDLLVNESLHFDDLVRKTKLDSAKQGTLLSIMEMKGMIKTIDGIYSLIY